ncbi:ubiquinone/menaquinone biosynthesis C-methylase UbiE [Mucilaginibacter rubeus]|uniref:class I SAM-dependent methyltransferase n=1 Tax=Mucilaginibacter rubeus TaxID=2027860 RepID=UPI0033924493
MNTTISFSGAIPQHYQELLTPFLFDGFSADLMERIDFTNAYNVLELASGTGSFTKHLLKHLPAGAHLTASDLQADMLETAKRHIPSANVSWDVVDMTSIPYIDGQYDLIVCQFGLMLVPDQLKALTEMRRVLKKGGRLVFSVWADIQENPVWEISGKVIERFLSANPILQVPGPFALSIEKDNMALLQEAGFGGIKSSLVTQAGQIENAGLAAKGFLHGLPVFTMLSNKAPEMIPHIEQALEKELAGQLGNHPLISPLKAWIFETIK